MLDRSNGPTIRREFGERLARWADSGLLSSRSPGMGWENKRAFGPQIAAGPDSFAIGATRFPSPVKRDRPQQVLQRVLGDARCRVGRAIVDQEVILAAN